MIPTLGLGLALGCAPTSAGPRPDAHSADVDDDRVEDAFERGVREAAALKRSFAEAEEEGLGVHDVGQDPQEQPPVLMRLQERTPMPDGSYRVYFEVRPTVPVRVWHFNNSDDDELELAHSLVVTLHQTPGEGDEFRHARAGSQGSAMFSSVLMPPAPRRVWTRVEASGDARELVRVLTNFGFMSAPFRLDRGSDRAAGLFEQAAREASDALVKDLRARGFAGPILDDASPVRALAERLRDVVVDHGGLGCTLRVDLDAAAAEALTHYLHTGELLLRLSQDCDEDEARALIRVKPDTRGEQFTDLRASTVPMGRQHHMMLLARGHGRIFELRRGRRDSMPRTQRSALKRALERRVLRALSGS